MSKEAKDTIDTIKKGKLPPLKDIGNTPKKGVEMNQRGLERHTFGLQTNTDGKK